MIRLYIENQEMHVTEGFSHQITYAVDDLNNLDSKSTAFSKTIVLPGTAKNNYLLGNIFEFSNSNFTGDGENVGYNFNASRSAKCRLEINGLTIIKGVLRLLEIIRNDDSIEYEVAIFGELGGFFNKLQNKKLTDLDFSVYNHTYNISTIDNYWSDTSDYAFTTGLETVLVNGTPAYIDIFENVTDYIEVGDTISVIRLSNNTSYGDRLVDAISWDGTKTHIEVSANWAITPTTSFACKIIVANKKGFGVYYPLIDYGNYSTNKIDYKFRTFRPALHVFEYIDKIIKGAGYTWESKFFKSDFFKRLIVPQNQAKLYKKTSTSYIQSDESNAVGLNINTIGIYQNAYVAFQNVTTNQFVVEIVNGVQRMRYTGVDPITVKISVTYQYTYSRSGNIEAFSALYGSFFNTTAPFITKDLIPTNIYLTDTIESVQTFNTNSYVYFGVRGRTNDNNTGTVIVNDNAIINIVPEPEGYIDQPYNSEININHSIPENILQKDFFASLLKMFYLMVTEDKYKEKHLNIEPYTWFYDLNSSSYLDWSMKLDRSQPIRIKPMSETNARYYDIKHKSDTDYFNDFYKKRYSEGYGDVRFDNQLEFSKDAETTEVIFSSTPLLGYVGKDKITPAIFKWDGKVAGTNEENVNSNIRIMQKKGIDSVDEWNVLNDTGGTLATYSKYPYAGHFDDPDAPGSDLNFGATKELFFSLSAGALGNNLFNTFYSSYLAEITDKDSRLVTAKFKLNDTDIFNLDFSKFIWLDGVLYRLSKVVDYTPGEICTVELLRVIYTTYDNSVNSAEVPEIYINGLTWQTKNYEGEFYRNGDPIPQITDATEWQDTTEGAWCYYRNETAYGVEYGKLYNWYAVNDVRGLAPLGYHIPDDTEWTSLFDTNSNAYAWKESGVIHWNTDNGTDLYGFKALGGGERETDGTFSNAKIKGRFWSADEYDDDLANAVGIDNASATLFGDKIDKNFGFSIRLVKD